MFGVDFKFVKPRDLPPMCCFNVQTDMKMDIIHVNITRWALYFTKESELFTRRDVRHMDKYKHAISHLHDWVNMTC